MTPTPIVHCSSPTARPQIGVGLQLVTKVVLIKAARLMGSKGGVRIGGISLTTRVNGYGPKMVDGVLYNIRAQLPPMLTPGTMRWRLGKWTGRGTPITMQAAV